MLTSDHEVFRKFFKFRCLIRTIEFLLCTATFSCVILILIWGAFPHPFLVTVLVAIGFCFTLATFCDLLALLVTGETLWSSWVPISTAGALCYFLGAGVLYVQRRQHKEFFLIAAILFTFTGIVFLCDLVFLASMSVSLRRRMIKWQKAMQEQEEISPCPPYPCPLRPRPPKPPCPSRPPCPPRRTCPPRPICPPPPICHPQPTCPPPPRCPASSMRSVVIEVQAESSCFDPGECRKRSSPICPSRSRSNRCEPEIDVEICESRPRQKARGNICPAEESQMRFGTCREDCGEIMEVCSEMSVTIQETHVCPAWEPQEIDSICSDDCGEITEICPERVVRVKEMDVCPAQQKVTSCRDDYEERRPVCPKKSVRLQESGICPAWEPQCGDSYEERTEVCPKRAVRVEEPKICPAWESKEQVTTCRGDDWKVNVEVRPKRQRMEEQDVCAAFGFQERQPEQTCSRQTSKPKIKDIFVCPTRFSSQSKDSRCRDHWE